MTATRAFGYQDAERMTVDDKGQLLWDGNLVQVQKHITLSLLQKLGAILVVFGATSQGIVACYDFGCRMGWFGGCVH